MKENLRPWLFRVNLTWLCVLQSPPRLEESLDGGVNTIVDFFMCRFHLPLNACHKIQLMTQLPTRSTVKLIDTKVVIQRSRLTLNQVHLPGVCTIRIGVTELQSQAFIIQKEVSTFL